METRHRGNGTLGACCGVHGRRKRLVIVRVGVVISNGLAAFLIAFGSVGVAFALAVGIGSAKAIERGGEIVFQKKHKE